MAPSSESTREWFVAVMQKLGTLFFFFCILTHCKVQFKMLPFFFKKKIKYAIFVALAMQTGASVEEMWEG